MKSLKIIALGLLFLSLSAIFTGCKKDSIDIREQYIGSWQFKAIGSLTLFQNGQSIGTSPIDENGTSEISKSGENDLSIDGKIFTINGNKLSSDPESVTKTDNGVNLVGTSLSSGLLGTNLITLNQTITGSWSNSNGASGNYSGTAVVTFSK